MAEDRYYSDAEIEACAKAWRDNFKSSLGEDRSQVPVLAGCMLRQLLADRKRLEGRLCLICGRDAPCELDKDKMSPCTFDPSPIEAAQRFLRRAESAEAELTTLRRQLAEADAAFAGNLPCDIMLPPVTTIRKGCALSTFLTGIAARGDWPEMRKALDAHFRRHAARQSAVSSGEGETNG